MGPGRFSCDWEKKNGAMMMMSREVRSFTGVYFLFVLFLLQSHCSCAGPQAGHDSFNTHSDVIFNVCSWRMKNTAECSSDSCWYSSVYDLYLHHWPPCFNGSLKSVRVLTVWFQSWHQISALISNCLLIFLNEITILPFQALVWYII